MKEINIKIRFDDESGQMGFAIDREKGVFDSSAMTQRLICALDMLKDREKERMIKTQTFKTDYEVDKNGFSKKD